MYNPIETIVVMKGDGCTAEKLATYFNTNEYKIWEIVLDAHTSGQAEKIFKKYAHQMQKMRHAEKTRNC